MPSAHPGPYPAPPQFVQHQYVQVGRTSGLAIASMVLGIVWIYWIGSILAVIFGHISLSQIRKDETLRGRGMAIAGLALGYVGIGILLLAIIVAASTSTT
jgi:ABC-type microcin C transport system permease subunit YejE